MKLLVKFFIYLTIIVIVTVFNIVDMAQAKSLNGMSDLMFESSVSRMRRDVATQAADEGDIPKDELNPENRFRTRRETPPGESDIPQEFQREYQMMRAKRQMPSPPGQMPMPPM